VENTFQLSENSLAVNVFWKGIRALFGFRNDLRKPEGIEN
jgi:hypothetical protein